MKTVNRIIDRLKEPSTWAGLSAASLALGISTDKMSVYVAGLAGFFAFLSIIMKEVGARE